jgi:hypothetical protein
MPVKGGIFLTVKDLMNLTGSNSYQSCSRLHRTIRDAITADKKKLTIREYCDFEKIDFGKIWKFLRGS